MNTFNKKKQKTKKNSKTRKTNNHIRIKTNSQQMQMVKTETNWQ